ncbi:AAA family ATPase [Pirellulales bacterium]|nr:AAA family ATPase [Pirellulales bacterium]
MRIEELRLTAYGPFSNCALKLGPGLNILYGPNEAGKSSALRAIHALLFGIPTRSLDSFVHVYDQLRIGGVVVNQNGERLDCVRRKGRKHTLRDGADDEPLADDALDPYLGAVDHEFFSSVFGIDHGRLREGGEEVVRGEGRVGELLFAAGGVSHLREIQQTIDTRTGELFKSSAQKPRINKDVAEFQSLRTDLRSLQASSEKYLSHSNALEEQRRIRERLSDQLVEVEATAKRLRRIETALPAIGAWKSKRAELEDLLDAVLLPADSAKRHGEVLRRQNLAKSRSRDAQQRLESIEAELATVEVPTELLQERLRIDALYKRLGSHETATHDRGGLEMKERNARQNAREIIGQLGWSDSLEDVANQRLPDEQQALIRKLANLHQGNSERLRNAERASSRTAHRSERLQDQLAAPLQVSEATGLAMAVENARAGKNVADEVESLRSEVNRLRAEAEAALARLPLWEGALDQLQRLKIPSEESIDRSEDASRDLKGQRDGLKKEASEHRNIADKLRQDLAELEKGDAVPTEEELSQARAVRDQGLRLVIDQLSRHEPDSQQVSSYLAASPGNGELTTALTSSVQSADAIVDRLRREADRVAKKAQLLAQSESVDRHDATCQENLELVETERQRQSAEWADRWRDAGIAPLSPREMRDWRRQYEELIQFARNLSVAEQNLQQAERLKQTLCDELQGQLTTAGILADGESKDLGELIEIGQAQLEEIRNAKAAREQLEKQAEHAQTEAKEAEQDLIDVRKDHAEWKSNWANAMAQLRLPSDALPEQAESVLTNLSRLFAALAEADRNHRRMYGIDKTAEEFERDARTLAATVAPDLAERPVEEIAAELNARMIEARDAQQRSQSLIEQRQEQEKIHRQAASETSEADAEFEAMMHEAACERVEELPSAIDRSDQKRALQDHLQDLATQLAPSSGGSSVEDFATEAEAEDPDQLTPRIAGLDEQITRLREERDEALTAEQRETSALEAFDGSGDAANVAVERQFLLSKIEDDAHEYVVTRVEGALLKRAIETYQHRAQGPILSLASSLFSKLTCGSFDGLRADYDENGNEVLKAVRPNSDGLIGVEAMSEGSRDQLYLALRIATLEHWFEHHEPVPFIVDDVLLSFDDARAEASLKSLLELAQNTQVLFFTHHDHLVSLAKQVAEANDSGKSMQIVTDWGCREVAS